ncbi:class I SAM-dependent methyltransferase [Micromonospora sp. NPDC005367]|uniref:class I SAM-dependent methyltransferase n=1 Tax=Micromonospora sp. NPDC005367 TaxID=3155590 RepID=UPI0033B01AB7
MSCREPAGRPDVGELAPRARRSTQPTVPVRAEQARGVSHRQRWVVETLAIDPDDQVLEIGCGRGTAVFLVADRLTSGRIVAIDRSATMVRLAAQRNEIHISSGRAEIRRAELESVDFPPGHFTKIFAVNVSLFWLGAATPQMDRLRHLLAPQGRLYVFGERPTAANVSATEQLLATHGFATTTTIEPAGQGRVLSCVTGTLTR